MTPPRSMEEWAEACRHAMPSVIPSVKLCLECARTYAAEQVAQARQEWMEQIARIYQREHDALPDDKKDGQAVAAEIAAAIRAGT